MSTYSSMATKSQIPKVAFIDDGINSEFITSGISFENYTADETGVYLSGLVNEKSHGTMCYQIFHNNVHIPYCLISIKVLDNATGLGSHKALLSALNWCASQDISVINMSMGTRQYTDFAPIAASVSRISKSIIVAACSNENELTFPACLPHVIGVRHSNHEKLEGNFAYLHNPYDQIDVVTCVKDEPICFGNNHIEKMSGANSFATPLITARICNYIGQGYSTLDAIRKQLECDSIKDTTFASHKFYKNLICKWESIAIPYVPAESIHAGREDLPVRTLSLLSVSLFEPLFLEAESRIADEWAARGYNYNFELALTTANVIDYLPDDFTLWTEELVRDAWDQMLMRVRTQLMAGQGYDIICFALLTNFWNHIETGLFTDIYQLIDQCPHTNREDFFTQALAPFEMDGRLYAFPTNFGLAYVGVNANLPQPFIDRFSAMHSITVPQLMSMYLELQQYPEFAHLAFASEALVSTPYSAFHHVFRQFIDFPSSRANLTDDRFVSFLRDLRQVYSWTDNPNDSFPHRSGYGYGQTFLPAAGAGAYTRRVVPFYHIQNVSGYYAFWVEDAFSPALTMVDSADSPFLHFIPIADYQGRLTYVTSTPTLTVTTRADGALAWEFIQHLIYVTVNPTRQAQYDDRWHAPWGRYTLNTPILRAYFEAHFTENLTRIIDDLYLGETPNIPGQVERALARVASYNEMPLTYRHIPIPRNLYFDIYEQLFRGLITPEDAAQQLHNRVSLWLIE